MSKNFALIGAGGYIAPRHMKAIKETGNTIIAAYDKHDSVGIMDSYFPDADFFTEFERFDRHLDKQRRMGKKVDYISICSPNYLHDSHIRFALRQNADAICEKPLVLNPWNIDALLKIEQETGRQVHNILQLRLHPSVIELKEKIKKNESPKRHQITLTYITARGKWYNYSWKGDISKSGGIATNIGVHFFDMLIWVFGSVEKSSLHFQDNNKVTGTLHLKNADVKWFLSIDYNDIPDSIKAKGQRTYRSLTMDGKEFNFSDGFTDLHTRSYQHIFSGSGFRMHEVYDAIKLVHSIRNQKTKSPKDESHPLFR
jgi:UDP-N-acetyl-2-amino-2-deoxyglucuronate dehydrogenase